MPNVLIATPIRDWLYSASAKCFFGLVKSGYDVEWDDDRILPRARNNLAEKAIAGGYEYVFFIDSDMVFEADDVEMVLDLAEQQRLDIVAGRYFNRAPPYNEQAFIIKGEQSLVSDPNTNPVVLADGVGAGFLLVRTSAFSKIPRPWFDWNNKVSEDIHFCNQARLFGFKIWYYPLVTVGHVGPLIFGTRTFKSVDGRPRQ